MGDFKSTWFPRGCSESCPFLATCPRYGHDTPDAGALIVIDESHTDFPQRSSGKAPPAYVEALTVHRHQGLDFWFVSQRPSFLDPFIRGLSSRHIHLGLNPFSFVGNRNRYEWSEYQETVNRSSKMLAAKTDYKPSPAVFPLYASASVHTKLDQRMPTVLKAFIAVSLLLVLAVGFGVYRVKSRINDYSQKPNPSSSALISGAGSAGGQRSGHTAATSPDDKNVFHQVVKVDPVPLVSVCMATKTRCQCYTYQGVKVLLTEDECRENARSVNDHFRLPSAPSSNPLLSEVSN